MGKVKTFELVLADNKSVYHPGDLVTGKCVIELKNEIRFRTIRVYIRGVAKVHWTESRSTGTRLGAYTEHFNSEVEYFNQRQLLYGNDESKADLSVLPEGKFQFTFIFELPYEGISTSFEGKHGNIRYWLKAEIDKPWSFNYKTKKAFTVISPIDINKPIYQGPVENSVEKSLCCCFCRSGTISIDARTDRKGYCPGESIMLWAEFDNQSNRTVIPYASLHQIQTFLARGKSRIRVSKFTSLTGWSAGWHSQSVWDGLLMKIPVIPPTVANCFVIRVEYFIKIALHIPGSSNLCMLLPITIGTTPYRRNPVSGWMNE
ncbi:hypothetical protein HELRODRAFT_91458 [Helobdella robusta]|uniref:Arrestin C-terminal-like domain-containing protein n=1 Tax=Helobdella robusta TaxID=6412 RepID=T1G840_HELRO|nr:hypothetical protein HELRODRAFT_91458 [Helobdella robusta]ESO11382.1 hypothetical protein HELRODRAFT_91458 [Helobdella robusta]